MTRLCVRDSGLDSTVYLEVLAHVGGSARGRAGAADTDAARQPSTGTFPASRLIAAPIPCYSG